jgi:hypothetical protein
VMFVDFLGKRQKKKKSTVQLQTVLLQTVYQTLPKCGDPNSFDISVTFFSHG